MFAATRVANNRPGPRRRPATKNSSVVFTRRPIQSPNTTWPSRNTIRRDRCRLTGREDYLTAPGLLPRLEGEAGDGGDERGRLDRFGEIGLEARVHHLGRHLRGI